MPDAFDLRRDRMSRLLTRLEEKFQKLNKTATIGLSNDLETRSAIERFFSDVPPALAKAKIVLPELVQSELDVLDPALTRLDNGLNKVSNDTMLGRTMSVSDFEFASNLLQFLGIRKLVTKGPGPQPEVEGPKDKTLGPQARSGWDRRWVRVGLVSVAVPIVIALIGIAPHFWHSTPASTTFPYTGTVADNSGQAVTDARVNIEVDGNAPITAVTDSNGVFHVALGTTGQSVHITITATGYRRYTEEAVLNGTGRGTYTLQKVLPPKPIKTSRGGIHGQPSLSSTVSQNAATVVVTEGGQKPVRGVDVLAVMSDGTHLGRTTDENGFAVFTEKAAGPVTLYCAHPGYHHFYKADVNLRGAIPVSMNGSTDGGSVIFPESVGFVPGLDGRLDPILDSMGRTYLYAENIAVDGGKVQPVPFTSGRPFQVRDSHGHTFQIEVVSIIGASSLIEYSRQASQ